MGMYSSKAIAEYILSKYGAENDISPMKLIKLVYIAHGWYLGITDNSLIDENPEAWKYGPVIPGLYHEYKSYGNSPIKKGFSEVRKLGDIEVENFLDKIWETYKGFTALQLSAKTHEFDTPWTRVWNSLRTNDYSTLQIPENYIKDYYKTLLLKNKQTQSA